MVALDAVPIQWQNPGTMLGHLIGRAIGRTSGGRFVNAIMMLAFVLVLPVLSVAGLSYYAWNEVKTESRYQHNFGADWKAQYELDYGSVGAARAKIAVAIGGAVILAFVGIALYRQLIPALRGAGNPSSPSHSGRRRRRK